MAWPGKSCHVWSGRVKHGGVRRGQPPDMGDRSTQGGGVASYTCTFMHGVPPD